MSYSDPYEALADGARGDGELRPTADLAPYVADMRIALGKRVRKTKAQPAPSPATPVPAPAPVTPQSPKP